MARQTTATLSKGGIVQGSALDRLLSDKTLRSRLANQLAETNVTEGLSEDGKHALAALDKAFVAKSLPGNLDLAITGSPGISVMALIGLTAQRGGIDLPLSSWGAGTRRLAALAIAEQYQGTTPITLVDAPGVWRMAVYWPHSRSRRTHRNLQTLQPGRPSLPL